MIHWLLETVPFEEQQKELAAVARALGHRVSMWKDSWWETDRFPCTPDERVIFHGSLENAARMAADGRWHPGAFCDVRAFTCSTWFEAARPWLLNREVVFTTVRSLVADATNIFPRSDRLFIRPDGPLKPFSGRVLRRDEISAAALDHGFYYDDMSLPISVSPAAELGAESRFVIVDQKPVAASRYDPDRRRPLETLERGDEWDYVSSVAAALPAPERVYVLDICATRDGFRLLELNPFSGADLYHCSLSAVARGIISVLEPAG